MVTEFEGLLVSGTYPFCFRTFMTCCFVLFPSSSPQTLRVIWAYPTRLLMASINTIMNLFMVLD